MTLRLLPWLLVLLLPSAHAQNEPVLRAVPVESETPPALAQKAGAARKTPTPPPAGPPQPLVTLPGNWVYQPGVSDEFAGTSLNSEKWESDVRSWGTWSWDPSNASLGGDRLALRMVHEPHQRANRTLYYKSGIVRSRTQFTYGYFEARIKGCPLHPGASPGFWLYSIGAQSGKLRYSEIDIVELLQATGTVKRPALMDFNLHARILDGQGKEVVLGPTSHADLCAHRWRAPFDPRRGFHVYSAMITPKRIVWFVNGREVASEENLYWHLPMHLVLSLALRAPHVRQVGDTREPVPEKARGRGFPTAMEVDYVRVWTPPGPKRTAGRE
jgi:beta-glucanase (GH16 family)